MSWFAYYIINGSGDKRKMNTLNCTTHSAVNTYANEFSVRKMDMLFQADGP